MGYIIKTEKGFVKKVSTYHNTVDLATDISQASVCKHRNDADSIAHITELISGMRCNVIEQ